MTDSLVAKRIANYSSGKLKSDRELVQKHLTKMQRALEAGQTAVGDKSLWEEYEKLKAVFGLINGELEKRFPGAVWD